MDEDHFVPTVVFFPDGRSVLARTRAEWDALPPGWAEHPDDCVRTEALPTADTLGAAVSDLLAEPEESEVAIPRPRRSHHKRKA